MVDYYYLCGRLSPWPEYSGRGRSEMAEDLNLNVAKCLREVTDFGVNHIHNICSGVVIDVPWGSVDWTLAIGGGAFGLVMLFLFGGLMIRLVWEG
jgi:hypothetical protein